MIGNRDEINIYIHSHNLEFDRRSSLYRVSLFDQGNGNLYIPV